MTSQVLNRWIVQAFLIDLLVCAVAYVLQRVNPIFIWVFIASLIILVWLGVAGVCSFIEVVAERD